MKRTICSIVIFFTFTLSVYSQGFAQVDRSQVFNGFTFGSTPESIEGRLQLDLTISYGVKYYKYYGRLLKSVYNYKTSQVNLGFRDEKLEYLDVYFNKLDATQFADLLSHLQRDYGPSVAFKTEERGIIEAVEWRGEHIVMQFYRYDDTAVDYDDRNQTVLTVSQLHQ